MSDIHQILKQYWGYAQFRPLQEDIVRSVLSGHDTLALLPTGGGKSVCFQVPSMAMEGVCLVVSPLIALMKDQVAQLRRRHINAYAIYSGMSPREIDITLDNCVYGDVKFLYLSPERLQTDMVRERIKRMKVCLLAVDEAHCISQWGYDFRPPYLELAQLRSLIPDVPVLALTATATETVKLDIQEKLAFSKPNVFQKSFARANLSYSCIYEENKEAKVFDMLKKVSGTAVVYVRNRKKTKQIAEMLVRNGISAGHYHAGLTMQERSLMQDKWIQNQLRVIVATNAFGMGIDKPDVRLVVHIDLPDSLEAYYQEAGRAGRDEQKAYAVLLYNDGDIEDLHKKIEQTYPPLPFIKQVYQSLANYYKIAVGSSKMAGYDFEIDQFQKTYGLPAVTTYYALKRLESEGFIQFNEHYYSPSKVMIKVDNMQLYEFQVANRLIDPFIKMLLRVYGGELFANFIQINENQLATALQTTTVQIVRFLDQLHQLEIIVYEKQKDKPQIMFMTERYDSEKLPIDIQKIDARKKVDLDKANAVANYAQHHFMCRTALLLAYFGEWSNEDCGVCDICIKKKKDANYMAQFEKNRQLILQTTDKSETLQQILNDVPTNNKALMLATIRGMLDSGELRYTAEQKIEKVQL